MLNPDEGFFHRPGEKSPAVRVGEEVEFRLTPSSELHLRLAEVEKRLGIAPDPIRYPRTTLAVNPGTTEGARRKFGEDYWEDWETAQQWVPQVCIKPQAAPSPPPEKDTEYGWGMPYGQLYARALTGVPDISATIQMVGGMFALGMFGTMMSGVVKGLK